MDDWRKDLTEDELREVEAEDYECRRQRKRAQDAMRMAGIRAGPAMPKWLTKQDKAIMLEYYIAAQRLTWVRHERYQVDHIVPLHGCYYDKKTSFLLYQNGVVHFRFDCSKAYILWALYRNMRISTQ